MEVNS